MPFIKKGRERIIVQVQDLIKLPVVGREVDCMRILWEVKKLDKQIKT